MRFNRLQAKNCFKSNLNRVLRPKIIAGFNRNRRDDMNSDKNVIEKVDLYQNSSNLIKNSSMLIKNGQKLLDF